MRSAGDAPVVHPYVGKLSHADFASPLAEIVPESERELDELYSRDGIIVAGLDPSSSYAGMERPTCEQPAVARDGSPAKV